MVMSLEEAERIARCRLPEEGPDPLADWRAVAGGTKARGTKARYYANSRAGNRLG
jgi:hypothetical protein